MIRPRLRHFIIPIAVLLSSGCVGDEGPLKAQGSVEVREVDVAPLMAGRISVMYVDEGAVVNVGDTLALLTAPTLTSDLESAQAWVRMARAQLQDLEAGSRPQQIQSLRAQLAAAEAEAKKSSADFDRAQTLWEAGAMSEQDYDATTSAAKVATEKFNSAQQALSLALDGPRKGEVAAARAEVARAEAALLGTQSANAEYLLTAPVDGMVLSRLADPGDLLAVGRPALVLGQMSEPWVRVYVPAWVLPQLVIGDEVTIIPPRAGTAGEQNAGADTGEGMQPIRWPGRIVAINPKAEYVTRTALTEDERADLLFGVKVAINDTTGAPKPGLPVTVVFPKIPASR